MTGDFGHPMAQIFADLDAFHRAPLPGPNNWDLVKSDPSNFGPEYDFIVEGHGNRTVIDPVSEAALQWCYRFLPEDAPRWGKRGYVIESDRVHLVIEGMRRENLMSVEDYENAMNAEENQREQWPDD